MNEELRKQLSQGNNTSNTKGAKCLRGQRPVELLRCYNVVDKSDALKAEFLIKQFIRSRKEKLIELLDLLIF